MILWAMAHGPDIIGTATSTFGGQLRRWRLDRRRSQLALACDADISTRHLSFLETGRASPSREMVLQLGHALDLPLEEQNALFLAAGFAPPFSEQGLDAERLGPVRQALDFILRQQEPYPAIVLDGTWGMRLRNAAATRIFGRFRPHYDMPAPLADNAMHVVFHPRGLRPFIANFEEFGGQMLHILARDAERGNLAARDVRAAIASYPDLPVEWTQGAAVPGGASVMTMRLRGEGLDLAFFSTFTTLALPNDAALQKLRIECFFPADEATAAAAHALSR